VALQHDLVA